MLDDPHAVAIEEWTMGVDLLAKYSGEFSKNSLDPANSGPCFRLGSKRAKYVVFRELSGKHAVFGYLLLESVVYDPDPDVGLVLRFGTATVTIKGRNLEPCSRPLMDHLVQDCCVGDERQGAPAGLPFITTMELGFK